MADKILVVDDEQDMRDALNIHLSKEGYEVVEASNGKMALELAVKEKPQLILLDIKMPGIDGVETCRLLKEGQETQPIHIIMVTADKDRFAEAHMAGADDFIEKPYNTVELNVRVKSALRVRHLSDDLERALAYIRAVRKNHPEMDEPVELDISC